MEARDTKFLKFLSDATQFRVPIYQRSYSWTEKECLQLWEDIRKIGEAPETAVHFLGSIVYIQDGPSHESHRAPVYVIDGQQRLTSITLLLLAIAESLGSTELIPGFNEKKIKGYYLLNKEESGERYYKLILTDTDKASLQHLTGSAPTPTSPSARIEETYKFFQKRVSDSKASLDVILRGLTKLVVVDVVLERERDNPQLIFESMNSTGKKLSQSDLIRNYVLMNLTPKLQNELYNKYWRLMEKQFGQKAYSTHFDPFARYFLAAKTGVIPRLNYIYDEFKEYTESNERFIENIEELVREMYEYSIFYSRMALEDLEPDEELKIAFNDLRELKADVAFPLLLELYREYDCEFLSKKDFLKIVRLIEAYMFRRMVCSIPSSSTNLTFVNLISELFRGQFLENIESKFGSMRTYRRFPTDDEFYSSITLRDLYHFRSKSYCFRKLENFERKEYTDISEYTIEHIMPQNENISSVWKKELGEDWKTIKDKYLHTIGNLTLTGYNSEYSDKSFAEKRDMKNGLSHSSLFLNRGFKNVDRWDEMAIENRAKRLADLALNVWKYPELSKKKTTQKSKDIYENNYTADEYKYLSIPRVEKMFKKLRQEIKSFNPDIQEVFVKSYIAYRVDNNFALVIPIERGLRIVLKVPFEDVRDPKGMCIDISGEKLWVRGDVSIDFLNIDDLTYVAGLVRQSLDYHVSSHN